MNASIGVGITPKVNPFDPTAEPTMEQYIQPLLGSRRYIAWRISTGGLPRGAEEYIAGGLRAEQGTGELRLMDGRGTCYCTATIHPFSYSPCPRGKWLPSNPYFFIVCSF